MTVWKYTLAVDDRQTVNMPAGATLLTVAVQNGSACVWAMVDPGAPPLPVTIDTYGTGHDVPDDPGSYLGTYIIRNDSLVFHVFRSYPKTT